MPIPNFQQLILMARALGCVLVAYAQVHAGPPLFPLPQAAASHSAREARGRASRRWPGQGDPEIERIRLCLLRRESQGRYGIVDPSRRWFGGYQFAMVTSNTAARRMKRPDLVGVPANTWSPADQDAAFYVIYDRGRGRKHWAGGRYPCK